MSRCEQEMCERWMGDHLCPCSAEAGDPDAVEAMEVWLTGASGYCADCGGLLDGSVCEDCGDQS